MNLSVTQPIYNKERFLHCVEQRRAEFQQMIHVVHQQVPLASLEAIRYDLGMFIRSMARLSRETDPLF